MKKKVLLLFISLLVLVTLTGCWNRRELNELAIAVAMGIDKEGDQYVVTVQIVDPGEVAAQKGGGARTEVTTYQGKGESILKAIRRMTTEAPRKIYVAHLRILVIGEEIAKEGIANILDIMSRDPEFRTDFFIVVAKGRAENILNVLTPLEKIPANKMFSSLETSERVWAPTMGVFLDELISNLVSEGIHPVLTGIEIVGDPLKGGIKGNLEMIKSNAHLKYSNMAVFKKDKLIGWLDEDESKGLNYVLNKVSSTVFEVPCPQEGTVTMEVIRSSTEIKGRVEKGKPMVEVIVRPEANVAEVMCSIDLTKNQTIDDLEAKVNQSISFVIEKAINRAQQEYQVDLFGFGEAIHRADPKYWKTVKTRWDEVFVDLPVKVTVESEIRRVGTTGQSFFEKAKE